MSGVGWKRETLRHHRRDSPLTHPNASVSWSLKQ